MKEKAIELLEKAEIKSNDFIDEVIYKTVVNNIAELLNKLELQENYNDMLVAELNELKAEIDRMQEHLMHNEAELIPLRKENDNLMGALSKHESLIFSLEQQLEERNISIQAIEQHEKETGVLEQTLKFNADVNIGLMKRNFELKEALKMDGNEKKVE